MLLLIVGMRSAQAFPSFDDGNGVGCIQCHSSFGNGNGPLHLRHLTEFGITTCNLCHPAGGGSTPVLTYSSGPGGGYGCAGCHGQNYGEISPNSGQPKGSGYGLRKVHATAGVTVCAGCHTPGALGAPNPFPPALGENSLPLYYGLSSNNLTDSCDSNQEDLLFDADAVGLDNDGDGLVDSADPDCPTTTTTTPTTTTTTTTLPSLCGLTPNGGCLPAAKASLSITEKSAGKEKMKVALKNLVPVVTPSQFGDPLMGNTAYAVCVYDSSNQLRAEYFVDRAGDSCSGKPCWAPVSDKGYKYKDKVSQSDGTQKIGLAGGAAGKGKILWGGKNSSLTMPVGVAAALMNQTSATVQLLTSDASCFGAALTRVKKADGIAFSALYP